MVKGFPIIHEPTNSFQSCILGKQNGDSFTSSVSYRERTSLKMVHIDFCGPMHTQSLGGHIYFLTFIDDFIRRLKYIS